MTIIVLHIHDFKSNTTKYEKQRWSWIEVRIKSIDKSWLRKDETSRRIRKNIVSKVRYNFHLAFGNQKFGAYGRSYWELTEQRGMIVASSDVSIFIQKRYCPMCSELAGGIWLCSGDFQSTSDVSCCLAAEKHVWRSDYWKKEVNLCSNVWQLSTKLGAQTNPFFAIASELFAMSNILF